MRQKILLVVGLIIVLGGGSYLLISVFNPGQNAAQPATPLPTIVVPGGGEEAEYPYGTEFEYDKDGNLIRVILPYDSVTATPTAVVPPTITPGPP